MPSLLTVDHNNHIYVFTVCLQTNRYGKKLVRSCDKVLANRITYLVFDHMGDSVVIIYIMNNMYVLWGLVVNNVVYKIISAHHILIS